MIVTGNFTTTGKTYGRYLYFYDVKQRGKFPEIKMRIAGKHGSQTTPEK